MNNQGKNVSFEIRDYELNKNGEMQVNYTDIDYDKNELFNKFNTRLKEIDLDYKTNLDIPKNLLMVTAWISGLSKDEPNKVSLYLFNSF